MHNWSLYTQLEEASIAAADFLAESITAAIEMRGACHVIIPGGNTPVRCFYHILKKPLSWEKIYWYLSDERCYPLQHPQRNDVMLRQNLFLNMPISHFYSISSELGPEQGAKDYREKLHSVDVFDIAFLGIGEDGHTASLFPANKAIQDPRSVVAVYDAPKPPSERISIGINSLSGARTRMVLAGGESKTEILNDIRAGESLPINRIGDINWFIYDADLKTSTTRKEESV